MISKYKKYCILSAATGFAAIISLGIYTIPDPSRKEDAVWMCLFTLQFTSFLAASIFLLKAKNRSLWWVLLLPALNIFGLLVFLSLKDEASAQHNKQNSVVGD
ncbi:MULTISPECIES: hypothetical protein [unclassified Methyloversatilis]|uniref:hypothetical protein n=1 Tax=unclassified Methyloversatilis TaxID=2639971 RepID=UPI003118A5FE